jgi:hypothetical protein
MHELSPLPAFGRMVWDEYYHRQLLESMVLGEKCKRHRDMKNRYKLWNLEGLDSVQEVAVLHPILMVSHNLPVKYLLNT